MLRPKSELVNPGASCGLLTSRSRAFVGKRHASVPSVDASANHREGFLWLPLDECNAVCTSKQLHTIFREQPPTRLEHAELEGWKTNRTETGLQHHGEDRNDKDESRRASAASRIASAVRAISTRTCGQSGIHSSSTSVWHSESVMAGNLSVP